LIETINLKYVSLGNCQQSEPTGKRVECKYYTLPDPLSAPSSADLPSGIE